MPDKLLSLIARLLHTTTKQLNGNSLNELAIKDQERYQTVCGMIAQESLEDLLQKELLK